MITVGVSGGRVAYVSSSAAGSQAAPAAATLSATEAWLRAAEERRRQRRRRSPASRAKDGWTRVQRRRPRDAADRQDPHRPARAARRVPDLHRRRARRVRDDRRSTSTAAACAPTARSSTRAPARCCSVQRGQAGRGQRARHVLRQHRRTAAAIRIRSASAARTAISAVATANLPSDDIVLKLIGPGGSAVASSDTGTSPEAVNYSNNGAKIADGTYQLVVCAFNDPTVPASGDSFDYTGGYAINTAAGAPSTAANPSWQYFRQRARRRQPRRRLLPARRPAATSASTTPPRAARGTRTPPTGTPTFTTQGNTARTAEARMTPLTPGPFGFMPTSLTREYTYPFGGRVGRVQVRPDAARSCPAAAPTSRPRSRTCSPATTASTTSRTTSGFTELNYNMQQSNFGQGKRRRPGDRQRAGGRA